MSNIVNLVKKIMPAVVSIAVSENISEIPKKFANGKGRKKLEKIADSDGNIEIGGGSGFFIDESGIILTSKHIVSDPNADYTIITNDDKKHKAEIIGWEKNNDIAILKIANKRKNFPTLKIGDSDKIQLGETVLAVGNAFGFKNTVSEGIVSGLSRTISAETEINSSARKIRHLIQTDAAINPGNSGGPLINLKGDVIGVNTVALLEAENIGLAIPINAVKKRVSKYIGKLKVPICRKAEPCRGLNQKTANHKLPNQSKFATRRKENLCRQNGFYNIRRS